MTWQQSIGTNQKQEDRRIETQLTMTEKPTPNNYTQKQKTNKHRQSDGIDTKGTQKPNSSSRRTKHQELIDGSFLLGVIVGSLPYLTNHHEMTVYDYIN